MTTVLDGLAWAELPEKARVSRIIAKLISSNPNGRVTNTEIQDAVKATKPPYGRGKHIVQAVKDGFDAHYAVYLDRRTKRENFLAWEHFQSLRSTRLNNVYASRFGRPTHCPSRAYSWGNRNSEDWERYYEWVDQERLRDKGDKCIDLTHQGDYTVCLMSSYNEEDRLHIAVRHRSGGETVRTDLRTNPFEADCLSTAALILGGPKVRAAINKGKRVFTDWVGRFTTIEHDGSDHEAPKTEVLPWLTVTRKQVQRSWGRDYASLPSLTMGDSVTVLDQDDEMVIF